MLNHEGIYGPDPDAFGHDGAGGSFGFADPGRRLGVGYVMHQMQVHPEADRRGRRLLEALYRALDRSPVPAESVGSVL
jgi:CubicO group peptidase (beta-lactamase class C family)